MKRIALLLTALALGFSLMASLAISIKTAAESATAMTIKKRYGVKSGIVKYEYYDGIQSGTEELYFTDWGMKEVKFSNSTTSLMGYEQPSKTATYIEGSKIYTVDLLTNEGTVMDYSEWIEVDEDEDLQEVGEKMMEEFGGEKVGTKEIQGYTCDEWVVHIMGTTTTWVYRGVNLGVVSEMMGMSVKMRATEVKFNVEVPKDKFQKPAVEYTSVDDVMKEYQENYNNGK